MAGQTIIVSYDRTQYSNADDCWKKEPFWSSNGGTISYCWNTDALAVCSRKRIGAPALCPNSSNVGTSSAGFSVYEDRQTFASALRDFFQDESNERFLSDIVAKDENTIGVSGRYYK